MITVIAIDPGGTTGFAIGLIDEDKGEMRVSSDELRMTGTELYARLEVLEPDILIYERFEYRNRARAGLELISRDLIGVMELYCNREGVTYYKQMPGGTINAHFNNKKLKELGVFKGTKGNHANEACMHLCHWFTFREGYKWNKVGIIAE